MKNIITIISVIIAAVALFISIGVAMVDDAKGDTTFKVATIKNDSLHDQSIRDVKESIGNANKRIDKVVDEQKPVNDAILKSLDEISKKLDTHNIALIEVCKGVKSMNKILPFLETTDNTKNK